MVTAQELKHRLSVYKEIAEYVSAIFDVIELREHQEHEVTNRFDDQIEALALGHQATADDEWEWCTKEALWILERRRETVQMTNAAIMATEDTLIETMNPTMVEVVELKELGRQCSIEG